MRAPLIVLATFLVGAAVVAWGAEQRTASVSRVYESPGGTTLRVLLDNAGLGGTEVEVAELTFPPNSDSGMESRRFSTCSTASSNTWSTAAARDYRVG
jgi:hypothetical protein